MSLLLPGAGSPVCDFSNKLGEENREISLISHSYRHLNYTYIVKVTGNILIYMFQLYYRRGQYWHIIPYVLFQIFFFPENALTILQQQNEEKVTKYSASFELSPSFICIHQHLMNNAGTEIC